MDILQESLKKKKPLPPGSRHASSCYLSQALTSLVLRGELKIRWYMRCLGHADKGLGRVTLEDKATPGSR